MEKLKEYWKNNKKLCILALVVIGGCAIYLITGQDIDESAIVEKICALIGC